MYFISYYQQSALPSTLKLRVTSKPIVASPSGKLVDHSERVMTVCTGSAILASCGVLDERRATTNKLAFVPWFPWPMWSGPKFLAMWSCPNLWGWFPILPPPATGLPLILFSMQVFEEEPLQEGCQHANSFPEVGGSTELICEFCDLLKFPKLMRAHGAEDLMSLYGPKVNWVANARWVAHGQFYTSSGVSAGTAPWPQGSPYRLYTVVGWHWVYCNVAMCLLGLHDD